MTDALCPSQVTGKSEMKVDFSFFVLTSRNSFGVNVNGPFFAR